MNVFELFATLGLDTSSYDKGLDESEKKGSSFGQKLGSVIGTGAKVAGAAIAATGAATIAGATAFVNGARNVAEYGDRIDKLSAKMGFSKTSLQEWDFILQHNGSSIETMKASMKTLSTAVETNSDAFKKLGISQKELEGLSQEEIFAKTISALQNVESESQRTYLSSQLLGRGATELGALLNMSAEETEAMRQQVHDLGGVMSDDAVKASAGFQDSLQNMNTALTGLKNNTLAQFLPAMSTAMDGLSSIFSGSDIDGGLAKVEEGVKGLADNLVAKAPEFFKLGGSIISALVSSIGSNLPMLLEAAIPIISQLTTTIIDLAPTLIQSIFTLINSILSWLTQGEGLSTMINGVMTLISSLVQTITNPENIVSIINAAIMLVQELINGILSAIPLILEQLPVIIDNICTALLEGLPLLLDAGLQLFMAIVDAIPSILNALMENLPTIINTIIDFVLQALPMLLKAAVELFMAIIKALPTIISLLVKELPKIVSTIISTLLSRLPELIKGAVELFMGIIKAIPQIIIELGRQMPTIIKAVVDGLKQGASSLANAGIQLMQGLLKGLKEGLSKIGDGIKKIGSSIVGAFKKVFKIASPSRLMSDEVGKFLGLGIGSGFEKIMPSVISDMVDSTSGISDKIADAMAIDSIAFNPSVAGSTSFATGSAMNAYPVSSGALNVTMNIYAKEGQDIRELAKVITDEIQNMITDKEKVYA